MRFKNDELPEDVLLDFHFYKIPKSYHNNTTWRPFFQNAALEPRCNEFLMPCIQCQANFADKLKITSTRKEDYITIVLKEISDNGQSQ